MSAQTQKDRRAELARQDSVTIAVANRNLQISEGADPDPNVGTGFYPGEDPKRAAMLANLARARAAKGKGK